MLDPESILGQNSRLIVKVIYSGLGADAFSPGLCDHHILPSPHGPVGDVLGLVHHAAVDHRRRDPCLGSCYHCVDYLAPDYRGGVCAGVNRPRQHLA